MVESCDEDSFESAKSGVSDDGEVTGEAETEAGEFGPRVA